MNTGIGIDECLSFINCQLTPASQVKGKAKQVRRYRAVTISRQAGSGAHSIAEHLAAYLQKHNPVAKCPWTVFDRNLVEKVLEDHHLPKRMAQFIPEDGRTELQDAMDELFGLRPASWTIIQQTSETILRLVDMGNVIIIGRGASIVTRRRDDVLHVRLIGSEKTRSEHMRTLLGISRKAAVEMMKKQDRARARYVKRYFQSQIEDPLLYHLTINTDFIAFERTAELIGQAALQEPEPSKR